MGILTVYKLTVHDKAHNDNVRMCACIRKRFWVFDIIYYASVDSVHTFYLYPGTQLRVTTTPKAKKKKKK